MNILHDLYYGRISPWERRPVQTEQRREMNRKIEDENRYFISKMSLDDCRRFQELTNLYSQAGVSEEIDAFGYGLRLGILLLVDVCGMPGKETQ